MVAASRRVLRVFSTAPGHGHAEMAIEHGRRVGEQHRHRIVMADAELPQCGGKAAAALAESRIADALPAMDHGDVIREDLGGSVEEGERGQGLVVGWVAVQPMVIGAGHGASPEMPVETPWEFSVSACQARRRRLQPKQDGRRRGKSGELRTSPISAMDDALMTLGICRPKDRLRGCHACFRTDRTA